MKRLRTWWRGVGRVLLPCLLALMVLVPSIDAVVCGGDASTLSTPAVETVSTAKADHRPADRRDAGEICQHGHCHHSAPMLLTQLNSEPARGPVETLHPMLTAKAAPSRAPAGLERPPRA